MANCYTVEITNEEKVNQNLALEIFNILVQKARVRSFDFCECGKIEYNTRGLVDVTEILEKYDITDEDIKVEDEFERFWTNLENQYYDKLPLLKEYNDILTNKRNEKEVLLSWNKTNHKDETTISEYFKDCWGSRSFVFNKEKEIIIGIKMELKKEIWKGF